MDFNIVLEHYRLLVSGLGVTIQLTIFSVSIGFLLALVLTFLRSSKSFLAKIVQFYIYCIRGTPLLIQLFLIYYGLPQFDFISKTFLWEAFKEPYFCALLALTLNTSAYGSEIIRGGIQRTPKTEIEAAIAFGLNKHQTYFHIIMPSVIYRILPAYFNEIILMLHATSLVSIITIIDLTGAARIINSTYYAPFEAFISVGAIYLFLTILLVGGFSIIEKKFRIV